MEDLYGRSVQGDSAGPRRGFPRSARRVSACGRRPPWMPRRRRLYVATAGNYSVPATELGDAVVALDLESGRIVWSKQFTAGDVFSGACPSQAPSCPDGPGPDFDFGAPAILIDPRRRPRCPAGRTEVGDRPCARSRARRAPSSGRRAWAREARAAACSGAWPRTGETVYAAVSDMDRTFQNVPLDPKRFAVNRNIGGGLAALRIADGSTAVGGRADRPAPIGAPAGCSPSQSAAVTVIPASCSRRPTTATCALTPHPTAGFSGTSTRSASSRPSIGVKARGGSIDGPGVVVVGGIVFVTSGYSRNGGVPGTCCSRSRHSVYTPVVL